MSKILSSFWGKEYQSLTDALLEVQDAYLESGVTTPNCAFYGPFVFDQKSRRHIRRAQLEDTEKMQQSIMSLTKMENKLGGERESTLKSELLWTLKTMKLVLKSLLDTHKISAVKWRVSQIRSNESWLEWWLISSRNMRFSGRKSSVLEAASRVWRAFNISDNCFLSNLNSDSILKSPNDENRWGFLITS